MEENIKYGLMGCSRAQTNVGDYVQAIAARQYLPKIDVYRDREDLHTYNGDDIKMIMNGWYMHNPSHWPPTDKIDPLFVAMHINSSVYEQMTSAKSIEYFKKHQPIGCRDKATARLLSEKGVAAYYSGCLTLTLGQTYHRNPEELTDEILFIDPLFHYFSVGQMLQAPQKLLSRIKRGRVFDFALKNKVFKKTFSEEILKKAKFITQIIPETTVEKNFEIADEYLKRLAKAKLVVTSRIHCALPCLAMGTPVIFLNGGFEGFGNRFNSRFEGLIDFFNRIDISEQNVITNNFNLEGKIELDDIPENKTRHIPYAQALISRCTEFINNVELNNLNIK